ncbi:Putative cation efflux system transmembrane protein [Croceitalea dokdonensis DOKDO 023]|uniref:Putative cation efflux system transmembrane protein n=1 Tax=Croceitalea dokdonensis DOKDO 023 TaxID=1300341 RepID=A0A0P7AB86_9FLAO|nr:efflux RND transporter permease subunit [Croceitalea dokdonensis]KPM30368.1 Putative cation efflux system transmembrane protein [Croceitalea dokdonensis DOKDO 023]
MLHRGIAFLVKNKFISFIVIGLVLVFGISSSPFHFPINLFPKDPVAVDAIPNIGDNQQIVFTEWVGNSPQDIEDQITYPLTTRLLGIPGVKTVRSNSMFGFSSIYIIFEDDIEFYWSRARVLEKLNSLPDGLLPTSVRPKLGPDATALGQIYWYTLEGRDEEGNVTGGWDLQELRSIQDFYVKNALSSTTDVAEVASVGGFVKEYQINVDPELMRQYGISLSAVVQAVKASNRDVGVQTLEINQAEYFVRGLGYINSLEDIESITVSSKGYKSIRLADIASIGIGPAERRGILDKGGAEVVGGVVTARFGANPMKVMDYLNTKIKEVSKGLPKKVLADGRSSQLTLVPFYDRSKLIKETVDTLGDALTFEILIAILVIILMLRSLRVSLLVSLLMPLVVLLVFFAMKIGAIEANIVALAGIAIAIGTIVDMGIILTENIVRIQKEQPGQPIVETVLTGTKEVSGAIVTAGLTTIVSFIPVFTLTGAEGKLFTPLAYTKTLALVFAILVTLFIIPPLATIILKKKTNKKNGLVVAFCCIGLGLLGFFYMVDWSLVLCVFGAVGLAKYYGKITTKTEQSLYRWISLISISLLLAFYWRPMGMAAPLLGQWFLVMVLVALVVVPFYIFIRYYEGILRWVLQHKWQSIILPIVVCILGFLAFVATEKEFMPSLNEGDFLLMPTSLPQAGNEQNNRILKQLDMAVSSLPEVAYVVGKAGRVDSPLDPAPMSMYENLISYKPEYWLDKNGAPIRFKTNGKGQFETVSGTFVTAGSSTKIKDLIPDENGEYFRNWREHIRTENDIWKEISAVTKLPGVTAAPKLQPIETRLVMLQTGMRSNLGIKVKGQHLEDIERFGLLLEKELRTVKGIAPESVFADRITGKPYVSITIDRHKVARYGISIESLQQTLEVAVGGKVLSETIEGRERYGIRVRYPRELRQSPEDLNNVYIDVDEGAPLPLRDFVDITYEKGPQSIKSEDGFLVGYVIFDKDTSISEVTAVQRVREHLEKQERQGNLVIPTGLSYSFSGSYENHLHATKTLSWVIPAVLLLIALILFIQFKSVNIAFMVFSGVAVAFAGGFIWIWLYGQPWFLNFTLGDSSIRELLSISKVNLSVAVWVGFIALFGIATDDGVVMATYLNQSFKIKNPNTKAEIQEATIAAGKKRILPCLMTTVTTILALLPILTSNGKGSEIMVPMAIPCLGGMFMALITLFVVPLLYCWQKELILLKEHTIK